MEFYKVFICCSFKVNSVHSDLFQLYISDNFSTFLNIFQCLTTLACVLTNTKPHIYFCSTQTVMMNIEYFPYMYSIQMRSNA